MGLKPAYDTLFAFPIYEEIGNGGSWVPRECSEYVAVDITLVGPDYDSDEHQVGVLPLTPRAPMTGTSQTRLIDCAEEACDPEKWNTQVCFHYSTDANAAYAHANNIAAGAFGMACTTPTAVSASTWTPWWRPRSSPVPTSWVSAASREDLSL